MIVIYVFLLENFKSKFHSLKNAQFFNFSD